MYARADSQGLHLQEAPENSEVGQLPRAVDILVTNDLVDKVKPGDRVQVRWEAAPICIGVCVCSGVCVPV